MSDQYLGKDYTVSDIDVQIDGVYIHYEHIRMEILSYDASTDLYLAELKTGDQYDGKRVKVSGYFLKHGLGGT